MKKWKHLIKCVNCGYEFEREEIASVYQSNVWLDGKPEQAELIPIPVACPNCHRISFHPDRASISPIEEAYDHMFLCWGYEEHNDEKNAVIERKSAVEAFENAFQTSADENSIISYIDSLRQLKMYERAEDAARQANDTFTEHLPADSIENRIIAFEIMLITSNDSNPHKINEAL